MKKILLLILLLSISFVYSKDLQFYNIDGTEIITKETEALTIKKFQEIYFPQYKFLYSFSVQNELYSEYFGTGILAVYYQEFTDKPIFILGNSPSKEQINKALNTFSYEKYLKSREFNFYLKKYVNERKLTIEDLYKTFGKPSKETTTSSLTFFHYKYPSLDFTIKDGIVIEFIYIKPD